MGADYIAFIGCELQGPLGKEGFQRKLKLLAYRRGIEGQVPPDKRAGIRVQVSGTNRATEQLTYDGIVAQLGSFESGCPACASCPVGGGQPVGCYRYVTYPIDAAFEEALFAFFVEHVATKGSIADQMYQTVVSKLDGNTSFHPRGQGRGFLAMRPAPLEHSFGGFLSKKKLDSAQLLQMFFTSSAAFAGLDDHSRFAVMVAYSRLIAEVIDFARQRIPTGASRTLEEVEALRMMYLHTIAERTERDAEIIVDA